MIWMGQTVLEGLLRYFKSLVIHFNKMLVMKHVCSLKTAKMKMLQLIWNGQKCKENLRNREEGVSCQAKRLNTLLMVLKDDLNKVPMFEVEHNGCNGDLIKLFNVSRWFVAYRIVLEHLSRGFVVLGELHWCFRVSVGDTIYSISKFPIDCISCSG